MVKANAVGFVPWGLEICARRPERESDTITAIPTPSGVDAAEVIDVAFRRYRTTAAPLQGPPADVPPPDVQRVPVIATPAPGIGWPGR